MTSVARVCSVEGCERKHSCKSFCSAHYKRYTAGKDVSSLIESRRGRGHSEQCPVSGCSQRIRLRGYCQTHAVQKTRFGYVTTAMTRGEFKTSRPKCLVSDCERLIETRKGVCKGHCKTLDTYRLTVVQLNCILDSRCELCGSQKSIIIDHDHSCCSRETTGRFTCGFCIRGILCDSCNRGLGLLGDNADSLTAALKYLSGIG